MNINGLRLRLYWGPGWHIWIASRHMGFYGITCDEEVGIGVGREMLNLQEAMRDWVTRRRSAAGNPR